MRLVFATDIHHAFKSVSDLPARTEADIIDYRVKEQGLDTIILDETQYARMGGSVPKVLINLSGIS